MNGIRRGFTGIVCALVVPLLSATATGADLDAVLERGVLRHLGVPYANFVTGAGDGLDVELIRRFAEHLGVRYEYVRSSWPEVFGDLIGRRVRPRGTDVELLEPVPVRGDLIANGATMLPWREKIVAFSEPTFPSGVWVVARADTPLSPVAEGSSVQEDIRATRRLLGGTSVLAMKGTCLDPGLYRLHETGARVRLYTRSSNLNELVPAILAGEAQATLLDVPDALIALEKWPGQIKVLGPVTPLQYMGVAFPKDAPKLRQAFNTFLRRLKADGTYQAMVRRYYPTVFLYFSDFFATQQARPEDVAPDGQAAQRG